MRFRFRLSPSTRFSLANSRSMLFADIRFNFWATSSLQDLSHFHYLEPSPHRLRRPLYVALACLIRAWVGALASGSILSGLAWFAFAPHSINASLLACSLCRTLLVPEQGTVPVSACPSLGLSAFGLAHSTTRSVTFYLTQPTCLRLHFT